MTQEDTSTLLSADATTNTADTTGVATGTPPPADAPRTNTVLTTPTPLVGADGKFTEHWRDFLPEDLRAEECWKTVTDFPNMAKQFVNQRKAIGANKIVLPNEKSKPEEWDAFYSAIGRPKSADDYKVEVPEDLKEIFTDERLARARERAHNLGVSQKQFADYIQGEVDEAMQLLREQEEAEQKARDGAEATLRKAFGAAYDERMHVAKRVVAEVFPNEETRMEFLAEFGNNPAFIQFASTLGARLVEHKALVAELTKDTPGDTQRKIDELRKTPGYLAPYRDANGKLIEMPRSESEAITARIRELTLAANPNPAQRNAWVGLGR